MRNQFFPGGCSDKHICDSSCRTRKLSNLNRRISVIDVCQHAPLRILDSARKQRGRAVVCIGIDQKIGHVITIDVVVSPWIFFHPRT